MADERGRGLGDDGREPSKAPRHGGQPVFQRGELPGKQRKDAVTEDVHPRQWIPCLLAELGLGELRGGQLEHEQVAIDPLVRAESRRPRASRTGARQSS